MPPVAASLLQCRQIRSNQANQGLALTHSLAVRCLLLLILPLAPWVNAGQKVDVYRADVLVKNQGESERNTAARASFGELMVRVSGQRNAVEHPIIQQALPKAQNYLFGFTYKSTAEKITEDGKSLPALALQLNYEPQAIEQLLREAQLPLWPATRPKLLVWLVYKDATGLHQVPQVVDLQAMNRQAAYRGLPLAFPKLDLEDSLSLTAEDLWAVDGEKIKAASLRYKADAILVGRYAPTSLGPIPVPVAKDQGAATSTGLATSSEPSLSVGASSSEASAIADGTMVPPPVLGPWLGDWQLLHGDYPQTFTDETPEVAGLFASAIDRAADYFANQYAIIPTNQGPQTIVLRVGNITSFGAFKQAQRYLDDLAMVQRMEVVSVNADGLLVRLTTEGDIKLLMSTLALGRRLAPLQSDSLSTAGVQVVAAGDPASSVVQSDSAIDADAMAELDQALANEQAANAQLDGVAAIEATPATPFVPAHAGTLDDPLIYVWQK